MVDNRTVSELTRAFEDMGAPPALLAIINSWNDTLTEQEVLAYLEEWNNTSRVISKAIFNKTDDFSFLMQYD